MDLTARFIIMFLSIDLQVLDAAAVRLRKDWIGGGLSTQGSAL